jgi:hypothetical protein
MGDSYQPTGADYAFDMASVARRKHEEARKTFAMLAYRLDKLEQAVAEIRAAIREING